MKSMKGPRIDSCISGGDGWLRVSRRLIVFFLLLFLGTSNYVYTAVYYAFEGESSASITSPDVYLEEGTAGTSVVYPNGTSAASQVDSHATTFYPNDYNVTHGLYDSGTTPGSVNQIDSNYFTVNSSGSHTSNLVYYPSSYTLLNNTSTNRTWGITSSSFGFTATHTNYRYMGGTSPNLRNMTVTKLHIMTTGSGTIAIGLYTGGTLSDPTGAVKRTEAYNVAVSAGWNEIDMPDYYWENNTVTWIGWAHNTGVYYSTDLADAGDFQTANGRWNQPQPADADETAAMPVNPDTGSFGSFWYAVYAEYELSTIDSLTANDGSYMSFGSYLSSSTDIEDPVDSDTIDIDSSPDKGFYTNFTYQQSGPDSQYDLLREEYFGTLTLDYVDNNTSDVDSLEDKGTHSNFVNQKSGPDAVYDTLTEGKITGIVLSVEELAIDLSTIATSNTATLTEASNTSQVVPFATRYVPTAGGTMDNHESTLIDISISGSTVTASRFETDSKQVNTSIYCVEFDSQINVYSGTFSISSGSATGTANIGATISLTKGFLVFYYQASGTGNNHPDNAVRGYFSSTTQMTFSRATTTGSISGHWWVVEDTGTNFDVDAVDVTVTGASNTGTFDPVEMSRTMVVGSYSGGSADDIIYGAVSMYLSSTTAVTVLRGGTTNTIVSTVYVIEIYDGTSVQRGDISYTGAQTSLTDPLTSVTLGDSMAWIPSGWINTGHCTSEGRGSSDNLDVMIRVRLTSPTEITGERNNNGNNDAVLHWEAVEWEVGYTYQIDLEAQWTDVSDYYLGAEVAIKTGAYNGTEQLQIDFWNSTSQWQILGTLASDSWNNFTIVSYPDITNFTVRFKGYNETGDGVRDTWQIDASVIRLLGQGKREDPVDSDTSNIDSSPDIGVHSNFTAHQSGPDSVFDVLTETRFFNTSLVDAESFEGTWPPTGWTDNGGWNNETDQAHDGIISADIDGVDNVTLIDAESFEDTWPPSGWDVSEPWEAESDEAHEGVISATFTGDGSFPTADLDTPSFNMSGVHAIYVSFWFMDDDLDAGELMLQYWNGSAWNNITDLTGYTEDTWTYWEQNVTDSQYYVDDFQVRFSAGPCWLGEHFYLDEVTIKKQPPLGDPETSGDLDTPSFNCTGARAIYVSFWFMDDDLDATDLYLQYWNGSAWNNIMDLTGYTEDTWTYWEQNVTDSQYYVDDFKIRFTADSLGYNEHFYLDEVTVIKEIDASQYEDLDLEIQWTNVAYDLLYEELCIYAGSLGAEDIVVEIWNTTSSGWDTVFSDLTASSWNNASIAGWLTSDTVTVRYRGGDTTGDTVKNTWQIDIALIHTWDDGTAEYSLDMEYQWTGADFTEASEELCIYGGTMGAENILVDVWFEDAWNNVFADLSPGWNNVSVTQYLNSSTFTIRVRDGTPTSDAVFDTWEIDVSLLHVWGDTYTAEVEFEGTSNLYEWPQIEWTVDSAWTNASILVDIQLYNYSGGAYPASGDGFTNYTSGPAGIDETKSQTITDSPMDFRNATSGWKLKVRGEHTSQFDLSVDYIALNTTYYDEYTAQTEFVFTDITDNQSPNLNFTVVNHNSIDGATVTLQVWNYTSSSFPSSGMGYLSYSSTGANNTRWVNITNNAQSCLSGSYARIRVTSVYSTTDYYQQLTNFVRLLQEESILVNDYALRVTNNGTDLYTVRLVRVSDSNIDRIINCTIYFRSGETQLQVIDSVFTLTTGTWANLPASSSLDILIETSTVHLQYASVIDAELEVLRASTSTYTKFPIQFTII